MRALAATSLRTDAAVCVLLVGRHSLTTAVRAVLEGAPDGGSLVHCQTTTTIAAIDAGALVVDAVLMVALDSDPDVVSFVRDTLASLPLALVSRSCVVIVDSSVDLDVTDTAPIEEYAGRVGLPVFVARGGTALAAPMYARVRTFVQRCAQRDVVGSILAM